MEQDEGLWYEIALTNRQVLIAFVTLLACVVGAFLSGVWVGREALAGDAGQQVADARMSEEGDAGTFGFFGEGEESESAAAAASEGESPFDEARQEPEPPETPSTTAPPTTSVASTTTSSAPTTSVATTTIEPAEPEPSAAAAGPVVIQVFSSHDEEQAQDVLERLRANGFKAFVSTIDRAGRPMHRVRIGPFNERALADVEADRVRRELRMETWVTSADN